VPGRHSHTKTKDLEQSRFLFAGIPAKLVIDMIGEQESDNFVVSQWIPAGMTK